MKAPNDVTFDDVVARENERIAFMQNRDGLEGAIKFVKQGMQVYRASLAVRNQGGYRVGYGAAYRRPLVYSCIVYRKFLISQGEYYKCFIQ